MAGTLYVSGYLLSISQINDWADHNNVRRCIDDAVTLSDVVSYGNNLGFPSTFEIVDDGHEELHALLMTGFRETLYPVALDVVPTLIPEDTPYARGVRKAWIDNFVSAVPSLKSVQYGVFIWPSMYYPRIVVGWKHIIYRRRLQIAAAAAKAATTSTTEVKAVTTSTTPV
ncbi:hypothetical protein BV25DRAFT_1830817 [Artomyces pyxidatus]|uniref:Uncharacterized protein n=1 Tax=Artomyces pyxidatus TaxID=48021 RepID=A0ACB8SNG6_9AGAM|nr:hypothetical protein BV25DRAFT_1830817 [Artomyces pyxidatus]